MTNTKPIEIKHKAQGSVTINVAELRELRSEADTALSNARRLQQDRDESINRVDELATVASAALELLGARTPHQVRHWLNWWGDDLFTESEFIDFEIKSRTESAQKCKAALAERMMIDAGLSVLG